MDAKFGIQFSDEPYPPCLLDGNPQIKGFFLQKQNQLIRFLKRENEELILRGKKEGKR